MSASQPSDKKCTRCKVSKPYTEFYVRKGYKNNLDSWCKSCRFQYNYDWQSRNRDKVNTTKRKTHMKNPRTKKRHHLKHKYGITLERYDELLEAQNHVCASCGEPETATQKGNDEPQDLAVDHNHQTGEIRGLLCGRCNTALGLLKDDVLTIRKLANYLHAHELLCGIV